MTHKQTTAFHLFCFPQLHLGFFCFFTFTAWHKLWVLCLAFFRAWCASQIVTKAFLHAPHNKSFLYSFLSFVLHLTGTRKLQHCLVPTLMFLLFPFCRQRECKSTSNAFFLVFQPLFSRSPPLVFFSRPSTSYVSFEAVPSWNAIWYYSCAHLPEIHLLSRGQTNPTLG